jgi:hypothetical protein
MRKVYSTHEFKIRNARQAENRLKTRSKSKEKQKEKNRKSFKFKSQKRNLNRVHNSFVNAKAPTNFSFIENTEEVLLFLTELKFLFRNNKNVLIDLKDITNLTNDAIVLLLSVVKNPRIVNGVTVKGNYPDNEKLRKIFIESGVFNKANGKDDEHKNYILTRRNKKAEGGIASELIKRASIVVFGQEARCPGVYRALMESMANTCYHAKPEHIGQETWWITVYHDKVDNHVSFAFIDLGVGIFRSSKMNNFKIQAASLFGLSDNIDILKEIISGRKLSSTKIPYRGKGLPNIYKGIERNYYSNLKIISNDVKADLSKNLFVKLKNEFKGTFIYFELNNSNRWIK